MTDDKAEARKVAYHEAGHAVLFWNLGFGVERILIERPRHCGHAAPIDKPHSFLQRTGYALADLGGLAAESVLTGDFKLDPVDMFRSLRDFELALSWLDHLASLSDGEQLYVLLELTRQTQQHFRSDEIKAQIRLLATRLLSRGSLLKREIDKLLKELPQSRLAKQQSEQFVARIHSELNQIIARSSGFAPQCEPACNNDPDLGVIGVQS